MPCAGCRAEQSKISAEIYVCISREAIKKIYQGAIKNYLNYFSLLNIQYNKNP